MSNVVSYTKLWEPSQIDNAANETIYTAAPSSLSGVVKNISAVITNTTTAGVTVEVWMVQSGSSASDANKLINTETVPGRGRLAFTVPDMKSGDALIAKAGTATALTIHCTSGIVIN